MTEPVPPNQPELPFVTQGLPGVGGAIKLRPEHFVVEEIPLYEPDGAGDHLYICLTRQGLATREVVESLAALFDLNPAEVGYAGLKDKHATATQTLSLPWGAADEAQAMERAAAALPVTVHWARRHRNKLKPGHLLGNRFGIVVSELACPPDEALARAQAVAGDLGRHGLANFFGRQRFGKFGDNAQRGREIVLGGRGPKQKWLRKLLLSAFQSELFNLWLAQRMARGQFERILEGDMAKKTDTGGMFNVEDAAAEQPRLEAGEITYTGPLYGAKMRAAKGEAGAIEDQLLADQGLTPQQLAKARLTGSRRPGRLMLEGLRVEQCDEGLRFRFALPKGAYATVALREFMKAEADLPE